MANYSTTIDQRFGALSDPTRRAVLERLSLGEATVSELAAPFEMALPSFLKHVRVLEDAGLVATRKQGRVKYCALRGEALDAPLDWLERRRAAWTTRLAALDHVLQEES